MAAAATLDRMSQIPTVTDDAFAAEVLESGTPVLVDFTAAWCPPCRVMKPVLAELAAEREDVRIVQLDVDADQRTAAEYGVLSMPTFILFKDGREVQRLVGARPKRRLEAELGPGSRPAPRAAPRAAAGRSASRRRPARAATRGGAAAPRARREPTSGPGCSSQDGRHDGDAEPRVREEADGRRVGDLEQRHGAEALAWQAAMTVSRSAVPASARMNGRPRRSASASRLARRLAGREQREQRLLGQRHDLDARRRRAVQRGDADVGAPARHQRRDLRRRRVAQRDLQPGVLAVEAASAAGSPGVSIVVAATRTRPRVAPAWRSRIARARASSASIASARGSSASPAGVSSAPRGVRRSSVTPSSASSRRTCWESADCVSQSSSAARVKVPWRATATK